MWKTVILLLWTGLHAKITGGSNKINIEKSTLDMSGCKSLLKNQGKDAETIIEDQKFELLNGVVVLIVNSATYLNVQPGEETANKIPFCESSGETDIHDIAIANEELRGQSTIGFQLYEYCRL